MCFMINVFGKNFVRDHRTVFAPVRTLRRVRRFKKNELFALFVILEKMCTNSVNKRTANTWGPLYTCLVLPTWLYSAGLFPSLVRTPNSTRVRRWHKVCRILLRWEHIIRFQNLSLTGARESFWLVKGFKRNFTLEKITQNLHWAHETIDFACICFVHFWNCFGSWKR